MDAGGASSLGFEKLNDEFPVLGAAQFSLSDGRPTIDTCLVIVSTDGWQAMIMLVRSSPHGSRPVRSHLWVTIMLMRQQRIVTSVLFE
ncbi:hypothetical protein CPY51_03715 [Rhizobium tubonense]|uniref:Uncharacterized protein n=1 Tax=Rhizobium tubonense TaxID=484088 RepID=A0A2W4DJT5_9HYPH|nr:hypothetical protein CPY51_03715 [Rhizobium tubonense]